MDSVDAHQTQPVRRLVVAAASRHGSTFEIADRLAAVLVQDLRIDWEVTRVDLSDLRHLDGADAVVLGSAIYFGHWMRPAAKALEYLRQSPPTDLWLFSTGPVSEIESDNEQIISADAMANLGEADEHMVFGGNIDPGRLSLGERLVVKAVRALSGDHRNWHDVDQWAHHIATELGAQPVLHEMPSGTKDPTGRGMRP